MKYVVKFTLNRFASSLQATQDSVDAPDFVKIETDPEQSSISWGRGDLVDIDEYYVATADRPFSITLRREVTAGQGDGWERKIEAKEVSNI
jgi:hypothetical protein